jgi:ribonuclease HI
MSDIQIFTDGGCSGNPGPGAWAYIILQGPDRWSASEAAPDTTNNRMELSAVIAALAQVASRPEWASASLEVYTDSEYVQKGITRWIRVWETNGWRTSSKQPVKNQDLWQRLRQFSSAHPVQWHWLAGHAGHPLNEECDRLVRQAIARIRA